MDFMANTAFIFATLHAMVVTTLMECAITDASLVGKELIAVKVNIHVYALICFHLSLSLSLSFYLFPSPYHFHCKQIKRKRHHIE